MSYVKRWVFRDPYDPNPETNSYTLPRNPREMTGLYPELNVTATRTTAGKMLLWEGATPAKQFSFSGPILDRAHFQKLYHWTYAHRNRIVIEDHFGRKITAVLTSFDAVPKRRNNIYYSHEYTVTGLVIGWTVSTVPNEGPGVAGENITGWNLATDEKKA